MAVSIDRKQLKDFDSSSKLEWLETNGLGSYSSSTVSGAHTRKYHGLLVSALHPPVDRFVLLSRLEETLVLAGNKRYELYANQFPNTIAPQEQQYLQKFTKDFFPEMTYAIGSVEIKKSYLMVYGQDTLLIRYEVLAADAEFTMDMRPFIAYRNSHTIIKANENLKWRYTFEDGLLSLNPYDEIPQTHLRGEGASFTYFPGWYYDFEYLRELDRGQEFREDLFSHGYMSVKLSKGSVFYMYASTQKPDDIAPEQLWAQELARREALLKLAPIKKDEFVKELTLAADQFIVKRGNDLRTIIAGYPWFTDWGRDTMIALPGLCLVTGRHAEAAKILKAFAEVVDQGMIPNRFPDSHEAPEYNTVDATLWYFVAVYKYWQYTGDKELVLQELLPVLLSIIEWHEKGTRYHIKEQEDGLIYSGEEGAQLTWMDAKVGDWVVTPRTGKAVEINALWYNALKITAELAKANKETKHTARLNKKAELTADSFVSSFWCNEKKYLYDYLGETLNDDSLRPNQIIALSLPFELVPEKQAKAVLKAVEQHLLTPYGLRSLSDQDPYYRGIYEGNQWSRDGAYHQGTVWSWLLGPYYTAKARLEGEDGKAKALKHIEKFRAHLSEAGVGTVSEIFGGDKPFKADGCIAQAWGVSEVLRAYVEDLKRK